MRAIFLDRDGVLNRDGPGYVTRPDDLIMLPRAADAVALINRAGLAAVVVTNQSGVGRGIMPISALEAIHARLEQNLAQGGARLDLILSCVHAPWEGCGCRKPLPGMLETAAELLDLDLRQCTLIGDKPTDIECGATAGCATALVLSGLQRVCEPVRMPRMPDAVCIDVFDAVSWALERDRRLYGIPAAGRGADGSTAPDGIAEPR